VLVKRDCLVADVCLVFVFTECFYKKRVVDINCLHVLILRKILLE
jgi:hypothetical protein